MRFATGVAQVGNGFEHAHLVGSAGAAAGQQQAGGWDGGCVGGRCAVLWSSHANDYEALPCALKRELGGVNPKDCACVGPGCTCTVKGLGGSLDYR